jgi:hypothetical protein
MAEVTNPNVAELKKDIAAAATAIRNGDYASAEDRVLSARALLIAIPDAEYEGVKHTFARDVSDLADLLEKKKKEHTTDVIRRTKINYTGATD